MMLEHNLEDTKKQLEAANARIVDLESENANKRHVDELLFKANARIAKALDWINNHRSQICPEYVHDLKWRLEGEEPKIYISKDTHFIEEALEKVLAFTLRPGEHNEPLYSIIEGLRAFLKLNVKPGVKEGER